MSHDSSASDPTAVPVDPIERILVATDGSGPSATAVDRAIEIAAAHGASIDLLHVADPELTELEPRAHALECEALLAPLRERAEAAGVTIASRAVAGLASKVIIDEARGTEADLVVVGSRGRTKFDRILLGSVADRVIRQLEGPVLVVHPNDGRSLEKIRRVVVAVDFSPASAQAIATAAMLLGHGDGEATLELVHAADGIGHDGADMVYSGATAIDDPAIATLVSRLQGMAAGVAGDGIAVPCVVADAYPVDLVEREVARIEADLIVVGTHGRAGLQRLLLGSVAERIVHHADCPVVVVGS